MFEMAEVLVTHQGLLTLILKGEVSVQLSSLSLLVRNQLHHSMKHFFSIQNNLVLTGKNEEDSHTNKSSFRIKMSVPWTHSLWLA